MRSRKKAPVLAAAYRTGSGVSAGCPPAMLTLTRYGGASRPARAAPAGHRPGSVYRSHDLERGGPLRTPGSAARQGTAPRTGRDRGHGGGAFPAVTGVPWGAARTSWPGRNRQGPCMYEMQGPCPASPHRLASCPAVLAQRAARRGQAPVRGTGLPAPPTFPESPPGSARFRTVRTFLPPLRAPRKSPRPAISGFPAIREMIHRKRAVIRTSRQLSTG